MQLRNRLDTRRKFSNGSDRKKYLILPFFAALLVIVLFIIFRSDLFVIKKVEVLIPDQSCVAKESIANDVSALGKSFLFFDQGEVQKSFTQKYFCLNNFVITKKWPNSIFINAELSKPYFLLLAYKMPPAVVRSSTSSAEIAKAQWNEAEISGSYFITDKAVVLRQSDSTTSALPKILISDERVEVGKKISSSPLSKVFDFFDQNQKVVSIVQVEIWPDDRIVFYGFDQTQIIISKNSDTQSVSNALQLIVARARIEGRKFAKIDLRFENPVVLYK